MDKKFKSNFLKGSAAATLGTVSSMFFHFLSIVILTRHLTKHDFGIYVIILVIANLLNIISSLGLNITLVKFITGKNKEENKAALRAIIVIRLIYLSLITIIFYSFGSYLLSFFDSKVDQFSLYIPMYFILINFRDLFFSVLQGLNLYKKYSIVQTVSAAFRVIVILTFLLLGKLDINYLIFIEIFTTSVSLIVQFMIVPLGQLINFKPTIDTYKTLLKFSMPVYLNNILTFTYDRVSVFIIGSFLSPISVALFDVANKIPEALQRMFVSFIIVFFPNQSKLFAEGNKTGATELMNKSIKIFSVTIIFVVLVSFLFAEDIISIVFSDNYIDSAFAFSFLMLNFYMRVISNIFGYSLVSSGQSSTPVKVNSLATIINLAASFIMIPIFGFNGAVYSLILMNVVTQSLYHYFLVKAHIPPESKEYLKPILFMIVLLGLYYLLGVNDIILKFCIVVLYIILNWLFVDEFRNLLNLSLRFFRKYKSKVGLRVS